MKPRLLSSLVIAALAVGIQPVSAAEPARGPVVHGVMFLPLDFYPKHREALGLSDEQVRELQRIAEEMRDPAEKIERAMRERTEALHEAVGRNQLETADAMERFQRVLEAENEMKVLQFRTRMAMRSVLKPGQFEKAAALAKEEIRKPREAGSSDDLRRLFSQVKEEIRERIGSGEPPRELVAKLEKIEHAAKQGREDEAREQLEAIRRHLREERGGREAGDEKRAGGEAEQQMRKLHEQMERTTDPEQRERLQQQFRKMREAQERSRGGAETNRREPGAARKREEVMENPIQKIAEVAKRTENPEHRERLEGALKALREAVESGNREAVEDILRSIEPVLREAGAKEPREPKRD